VKTVLVSLAVIEIVYFLQGRAEYYWFIVKTNIVLHFFFLSKLVFHSEFGLRRTPVAVPSEQTQKPNITYFPSVQSFVKINNFGFERFSKSYIIVKQKRYKCFRDEKLLVIPASENSNVKIDY